MILMRARVGGGPVSPALFAAAGERRSLSRLAGRPRTGGPHPPRIPLADVHHWRVAVPRWPVWLLVAHQHYALGVRCRRMLALSWSLRVYSEKSCVPPGSARPVRHLAAVCEAPALRHLRLTRCTLEEPIAALGKAVSLESLVLVAVQGLANLDGLDTLPLLSTVWLRACSVLDTSGLQRVPALTVLSVTAGAEVSTGSWQRAGANEML